MRIFLSFNSKDEGLAGTVRAGLLKLEPKAEIFFSPVSLGQGFWLPKLAAEIHAADAFLLLLGPKGVGPWQELEYHEALARHVKDNRFALVPVIAQSGQAPGLPFLRRFNWIEAPEATDPKALVRVFAALKGDSGSLSSPIWKLVRPYQGLEAMTEANADYFFGRTNETNALLEALAGKPGRLPILIGGSGTGKSSIARAGVLSALKAMRWPGEEDPKAGGRPWPSALRNSRNAWAWLVVRPGDKPFEALAAAFTRLWITDGRDKDRGPLAREWAKGLKESNTLADLIDATQEQLEDRQGAKPARILVYLDQAEELYTRAAAASPKEAAHFSEVLATGMADPRLSVFSSLRADYFNHLQADQPLFSLHEHINVPPLTRAQLSEVVTGPASALGVTFEAQAPERIVKVASGEPGALPLVSYLLTDMWEEMVKSDVGKLCLPATAIDVGGVLVSRAEEFLEHNQAAETALKHLLTLRLALVPTEGEPVRRQARRAECTPEEWTLAETLADQPWRLVVTSERERDGEVVAEVAHEALLRAWPRLANWLRDERDFLIFKGEVEHREALWKKMGRADKALLVGLDLSRAEEWSPKRGDQLSPDVRAYIKRSIDSDRAQKDRQLREKEEQNRKLRRWTAFAAVLAVLASGIGVYAFRKADESEKRAVEIAKGEVKIKEEGIKSLEAQSRFLADAAYTRIRLGDPASGMLYALAGLPSRDADQLRFRADEAARALMSGAQRLQELTVLKGHEGALTHVSFNTDGRYVLTSSLDGTARLWPASGKEEPVVLKGHTDGVVSAKLSPDEQRIVTASLDGTARIWDARTGRELRVLSGHQDTVWSAVFSPDGQFVATASEDQTARIWNADTGGQIFVLSGHYDTVWSIEYSPDGTRLATASEDGTARLWNADTGTLRRMLGRPDVSYFKGGVKPPPVPGEPPIDVVGDKVASPGSRRGHVDVVWSAKFNKDGTRLVTASKDWSAIVWDAQTGDQVALLYAHQREVRSAEFSQDGRFVVTSSGSTADATDNTARVWSLEGRQNVEGGNQSVEDDKQNVEDKDQNVEGGNQNAADDNQDVRNETWANLATEIVLGENRNDYSYDRFDQVAATRKGHSGIVWRAVFSPDGDRVLTVSEDGTARTWDPETKRQIAVLRGHSDQVVDAMFSPDGKRVVTASKDGTARIWNAELAPEFNTFRGHTGGVLKAVFSPDGKRIVSVSEDTTARLWDSGTGAQLEVLNHRETVWNAFFSLDGKKIVTASEDWSAKLWDAESGERIAILGDPRPDYSGPYEPSKTAGHIDQVWKAVFSPDGKLVVTASDDDTARVWDVANARPPSPSQPDDVASANTIAVLKGHEDAISSVVFSPDGRYIATGSRDATARVWEARTATEVAVFHGHDRPIRSVAFSPDGRRVVSTSGQHEDTQDNSARVWDTLTGKEIAAMQGHQGTVWDAEFSPDGRLVVTASDDATARLWNPSSGQEIGALIGHEDSVRSAKFSPDGRRILTASKDGTARLWDPRDGHQVAVLVGHDDIIWSAEFSPDGRRIVTASQDFSIRLWDAETGRQILIGWQTQEANQRELLPRDSTTLSDLTPLIERARQLVPRCLTQKELARAFLLSDPPLWCVQQRKWPYHTAEWQTWLSKHSPQRSAAARAQ